MQTYLDFEKPIAELEARARECRAATPPDEHEATRLDERARRLLDETYHRLTPWQKTQVARAPGRPRMLAITASLLDGFTPLAGDRAFGDDPAIIGGLGTFRGRAVMAIGHEKGHDTASRVARNFGMARPEGYRKAARLMRIADRFGVPVISFVDTPGAYPGVDAEERGQAEAIARATEACLELTVPSVAVIVGEGGSGGAIALAAASRVLMLEHAVYSVISPEGCASILWKEGGAGKVAEAADAMKLTAADLLRLHVIDGIVREPAGGAHRDPAAAIVALGDAVEAALAGMDGLSADVLRFNRRAKFLAMGRMA